MGKTQSNTIKTGDKIRYINESISHLIGCVKYLENIRSIDYLSGIDEKDLEKVITYMQRLEESIERLNKQPDESRLIKAVGKNKKLWVTKSNENENITREARPDRNRATIPDKPKTSGNVIFSKNPGR